MGMTVNKNKKSFKKMKKNNQKVKENLDEKYWIKVVSPRIFEFKTIGHVLMNKDNFEEFLVSNSVIEISLSELINVILLKKGLL